MVIEQPDETKEWFGLVCHSAGKQIVLILQDGRKTTAHSLMHRNFATMSSHAMLQHKRCTEMPQSSAMHVHYTV